MSIWRRRIGMTVAPPARAKLFSATTDIMVVLCSVGTRKPPNWPTPSCIVVFALLGSSSSKATSRLSGVPFVASATQYRNSPQFVNAFEPAFSPLSAISLASTAIAPSSSAAAVRMFFICTASAFRAAASARMPWTLALSSAVASLFSRIDRACA